MSALGESGPLRTSQNLRLPANSETDEQAALINVAGGFARIYGPDGAPMCDQLPETDEGLPFAEIDLGAITIAKSFADPVGHYSRPDVTRLLLNRRPQPKVEEFTPELKQEFIEDIMTDQANEEERLTLQ